MNRGPTRRDRLVLPGCILVVALVAALPLALALIQWDMLSSGGGVGAGTGDLMAAALSSLDRDLHGRGLLPDHEKLTQLPGAAVLACRLDERDWMAGVRTAAAPPPPSDVLAGPLGSGYQLLL